MTILIFHQYFKLPNQAGSSRLYNFVKGLRQKNYHTVIVTGSSCREGLETKKVKRTSIVSKFQLEIGIDVISIRDFYDQKLPFHRRLLSFFFFSLVASLISIRMKNIDLVFASSTPLSIGIPAIILSKLRGIPYIFEVRDLWPEAPIQLGILRNKPIISIAKWLERIAYKNAKEIIGISQGICDKIEALWGRVPHFIPHGVDMEFYKEKAIDRKVDEDEIDVIYAGSCGYNNAIEILFEVAKRFALDSEMKDNTKFILVGDGPALEEIRNEPPSNLILKGKVAKAEVISLLKSADLALFSQRKVVGGDLKKISLPNKFFDFIGASLPIVAGVQADGEMYNYLNDYGCGITVDPEDVEGLYQGVKRLILDPKLRAKMSVAAYALAQRFSKKEQVSKFVELVEGCSTFD